MVDDICSMDGISLVRSVKSKAISPVQIVEAVLDRMDRIDTLHLSNQHDRPAAASVLPVGQTIIFPLGYRS